MCFGSAKNLVAARRNVAPMASRFGLIFGSAFIACEIATRSVDLFVVGQHQLACFRRKPLKGHPGG
jgi:hypothetical protein